MVFFPCHVSKAVFRLLKYSFCRKIINNLYKLNLQIDNLYYHLTRDLNINRKWLEKVIIFRRYISDQEFIPESALWGTFEKGTKKKSLALINNYSRKSTIEY